MKLKKIILVGLLWSLQLPSVAQGPGKLTLALQKGPRVAEIATGKVLNGVGMVGGNATRKVPTLEVPVASMPAKGTYLQGYNPQVPREVLPEFANLNIPRIPVATFDIPVGVPAEPLPSIFRARVFESTEDLSWSGAVFRYKGKTWGVVAGHAVGGADTKLPRIFLAQFMTASGQSYIITCKVQYISHVFDIALVEFDPEKVAWLSPLELDFEPLHKGDYVVSEGFSPALGAFVQTKREVLGVSRFVRTTMPVQRDIRSGLCGSQVRKISTQNGQDGQGMTGLHIGSTKKAEHEEDDWGYVAQAWQIRQMVEAYENGEAPFVVTSDGTPAGTPLITLQINEYVSKVVAYQLGDIPLPGGDKVITKGLPAHEFLEALLHNPQVQRIEFTIGRKYYPSADSPLLIDEMIYRTESYYVPEKENWDLGY